MTLIHHLILPYAGIMHLWTGWQHAEEVYGYHRIRLGGRGKGELDYAKITGGNGF